MTDKIATINELIESDEEAISKITKLTELYKEYRNSSENVGAILNYIDSVAKQISVQEDFGNDDQKNSTDLYKTFKKDIKKLPKYITPEYEALDEYYNKERRNLPRKMRAVANPRRAFKSELFVPITAVLNGGALIAQGAVLTGPVKDLVIAGGATVSAMGVNNFAYNSIPSYSKEQYIAINSLLGGIVASGTLGAAASIGLLSAITAGASTNIHLAEASLISASVIFADVGQNLGNNPVGKNSKALGAGIFSAGAAVHLAGHLLPTAATYSALSFIPGAQPLLLAGICTMLWGISDYLDSVKDKHENLIGKHVSTLFDAYNNLCNADKKDDDINGELEFKNGRFKATDRSSKYTKTMAHRINDMRDNIATIMRELNHENYKLDKNMQHNALAIDKTKYIFEPDNDKSIYKVLEKNGDLRTKFFEILGVNQQSHRGQLNNAQEIQEKIGDAIESIWVTIEPATLSKIGFNARLVNDYKDQLRAKKYIAESEVIKGSNIEILKEYEKILKEKNPVEFTKLLVKQQLNHKNNDYKHIKHSSEFLKNGNKYKTPFLPSVEFSKDDFIRKNGKYTLEDPLETVEAIHLNEFFSSDALKTPSVLSYLVGVNMKWDKFNKSDAYKEQRTKIEEYQKQYNETDDKDKMEFCNWLKTQQDNNISNRITCDFNEIQHVIKRYDEEHIKEYPETITKIEDIDVSKNRDKVKKNLDALKPLLRRDGHATGHTRDQNGEFHCPSTFQMLRATGTICANIPTVLWYALKGSGNLLAYSLNVSKYPERAKSVCKSMERIGDRVGRIFERPETQDITGSEAVASYSRQRA